MTLDRVLSNTSEREVQEKDLPERNVPQPTTSTIDAAVESLKLKNAMHVERVDDEKAHSGELLSHEHSTTAKESKKETEERKPQFSMREDIPGQNDEGKTE